MSLPRPLPDVTGVRPDDLEPFHRPGLLLRRVRLGSNGPIRDVRVADGVVAEVAAELSRETGEDVLTWPGATVLPGFVDSHVHSTQWASRRRRIDVSNARSPEEAVGQLVAGVQERETPPQSDELVMGHGYRDALWTTEPDKEILEAALPGQPVAVLSHDLHAIWMSPAALSLIGRDHPTGVLREQDCMQAEYALGKRQTVDVVDRWVADATLAAAQRGVTEIVDFEFADTLKMWLRRMTARDSSVRVNGAVWRPWLAEALDDRHRTGEVVTGSAGLLRVGPFKVMVDGSLNTRTAYCHDPYPAEPASGEPHGMLLMPEDELVELMTTASAHGLEPALHAIGDWANNIALNAFERVGCRGRIEHAQLLQTADLERFARLGVVASIQPQHAVSDRDVADRHWAGQTGRAFPYNGLHRSGAVLRLGSDAPVAESHPLQAIADAVSRTDDGRPSWHPEQALPLDVALHGASGGRTHVRVGDRADLTVLGADPAEVPINDLPAVPVLATLLAGRLTHRVDH